MLICFLISCKKNTIEGDMIITNINVIDVKDGKTISGQTIAIKSGTITTIRPYSEDDELKATTIIDGKGKYIMPGLWDMHAHGITRNGDFSSLFVANGVLGVREMSGFLAVRDSIVKTDKIMPKDFDSGGILFGDAPGVPTRLITAEDARKAVDSLHDAGADFIKVYEFLSKEQFRAIAERCNELNLPFAGHIPMEVTPQDASNLGQKSIEHLSWIMESLSSNSDAIDSLKLEVLKHMRSGDFPTLTQEVKRITKLSVEGSIDEDKLSATINTFKSNNTYMVPTLTVIYGRNAMDTLNVATLPHLEYLPKQLVEGWKAENTWPYNMYSQEDWITHHKSVEQLKYVVAQLYKKGVPMMAGTDAPYASSMPGFGLHKELQNFVELGMSNADALKTATIVPSKYLGIQKSYGTVEVNKIADLLILDKNPLEKIENTTSIYGVIQNGNYLNKQKLNEILSSAKITGQ